MLRVIILLMLFAAAAIAAAQDCARPRSGRDIAEEQLRNVRERLKPVLTVFTHPRSEACNRWLRDFDPRTPAGRQLRQWYRVEFLDTTRNPAEANQNQLKALPTFVTADERLDGYWDSADRVNQFLDHFRPRPAPLAEDRSIDIRPDFNRLLHRLEQWRQEDADRDTQLAGLVRQREPASDLAIAGQVAQQIAPLRAELKQFNDLMSRRPRTVTREIVRETNTLTGFARIFGITPTLVPWIAGALGITITTGGVGGIAIGVLGAIRACAGIWTWFKLRRAPRSTLGTGPESQSPASPVLQVNPPPPPQLVREEVRYQNIEIDSHAAAYAWAKQEMGKKFPNVATTFEQIDGFMRQFLAAKKG